MTDVPTIYVGRYGGAGRCGKAIAFDRADVVNIDCRRLSDPKWADVPGKPKKMTLAWVQEYLTEHNADVLDVLLDEILRALAEGKSVQLRCKSGKHRSQAMAQIALRAFRFFSPECEVRGPVYLGSLKQTK